MISKKLSAWITKKIKTSKIIQEVITEAIREYHDKTSTTTSKIWGDESRIQIGKHVHTNDALLNTVSGNIVIGDYSFFGHGVSLLTGTHNIHKRSLERQTDTPLNGRDIIIGEGVWVASNATILGPCEIGDNAVIGCGSIATGRIEKDSLYIGAPAKFVKKIL